MSAGGQVLVDLDCRSGRPLAQESSVDAGGRADLQYPHARMDVELLQHPRDKVGLGWGLLVRRENALVYTVWGEMVQGRV